MSRLNLENLEVGDLIFTLKDEALSKFIATVTLGDYSHAMIYAGNGYAFESTSTGVNRVNVSSWAFSPFKFKVIRSGSNIKERQKTRMAEYLNSQLGASYSITQAALTSPFLGWIINALGIVRENGQFCSRLVYMAHYESLTLNIKNGGFISPNGLLRLCERSGWKTVSDAASKTYHKYKLTKIDQGHIDRIYEPELLYSFLGSIINFVSKVTKNKSERTITNYLPEMLENEKLNELCVAYIMKNHPNNKAPTGSGYFMHCLRVINPEVMEDIAKQVLIGYSNEIILTFLAGSEFSANLVGRKKMKSTALINDQIKENINTLIQRNIEIFFAMLVSGNEKILKEVESVNNSIFFDYIKENLITTGASEVLSELNPKSLIDLVDITSKSDTLDEMIHKDLQIFLSKNKGVRVDILNFSFGANINLNMFSREICAVIHVSEFKPSRTKTLILDTLNQLQLSIMHHYRHYCLSNSFSKNDLRSVDLRDHIKLNKINPRYINIKAVTGTNNS